VENCEDQGNDTYETNTNNCTDCKEGYYKHNGGEECRLYPDGIANCAFYTNRTTCTVCKNNFYLNNNACTAVEADAQVSGCISYSSATQCASCEATKFLKDNECVSVTATGCASLTNETTCNECLAGYVKDENNANCIDAGIAKCNIAVKGSPNTCKSCQGGYLPNGAGTACVAVSPTIPNCEAYQSTALCKQCTGNFILALDKKSCIDQDSSLGPNCYMGEFTSTQVCDVCYPGYQFDSEGACVALDMDGCIFQDSSNKRCVLCMTGYYMNKELKCIKIIEKDNGSAGSLSNFAMLSFLILIVNKLF
jgi:hypothetical protein